MDRGSRAVLLGCAVGALLVALSAATAGSRHADVARRNLQQTDNNEPDACDLAAETLLAALADRIVGGEVVSPPFKYPYIVNLVRFGVQPFCGGSLIAPNVVLTAAHCEKSFTSIWIGRHDTADSSEDYEVHQVEGVYHPPNKFNSVSKDNDIMLLKLSTSVSNKYPPVAIDGGQTSGKTLVEDVETDATQPLVTVMGWGTTEWQGYTSDLLREVTIPAISRAECNEDDSYLGLVSENMLCGAAVGQDACQGDSGGPLIVSAITQLQNFGRPEWQYGEDVQIGIVSWGAMCAAVTATANGELEGYPGVYTRLANYAGWIEETLAGWGTAPKFAQPILQVKTAAIGPLPCEELPDHFEVKTALPRCTTSKDMDGNCMTGSYDYAAAEMACAEQGAWLCSVSDLKAKEAHGTGCGLNEVVIWTSTECEGGFMVATGGLGEMQSCKTAVEILNGNRCCGGIL